MSGEIELKCGSCKYSRGGSACEYQNLVKNYKTLNYECKGYVFSETQMLPKLKEEHKYLNTRLGEVAKELLDKDTKNHDLVKLHFNAIENQLLIIDMRIKELDK